MKALSLWQPHAQAIALGLKPYETRSWSTTHRGPIAIHAAKKALRWADYPHRWWSEMSLRLNSVGASHHELPYGAVVCIADLVDCVPTASLRGKLTTDQAFWGDFSDGRFAWKLENVQPLEEPLQVCGRQGLFEIPFNIAPLGRCLEPTR